MTVKELPPPDVVNEKKVGYSIRPGYKQTEVGLIPEDWDAVQLGSIASFRTGPFGSTLHMSDYVVDGVPIINPMQIVGGKIIPTSGMTITQSMANRLSDFCLQQGEIIIGRRGDMGRCAVITDVESGWLCGTGSMIVRVRKSTSAELICRLLSSPPIVSAIENASVGTTMVNLNNATMSGLKLPLPSTLAEQEAIAEALGDADSLVESLERLLAKKRHLKQAAMQQLLTGKKRLPGFEGEWASKAIGDLFSIGGGYSASRDQLSHRGVCYLHYGDIHGTTASIIDVERERHLIPKLDVSLSQVGSASLLSDGDLVFVDASEDVEGTSRHIVIKNPNRIPFISGLHTIVAKPKTDELRQNYCRYCFQTERVKSQFRYFAVGTKVSGVSKSNITKIEIALPSLEEQTAIATVLSDMDEEIVAIESKIAKARQIKQGMMQELLTGRTRLV